MAILTLPQVHLLRLAILAGYVDNFVPVPFHSAWLVRVRHRGGSVVQDFSERTGDVLVGFGYLAPDQSYHKLRASSGGIGRRYVRTA